jgi:uridylate kinase
LSKKRGGDKTSIAVSSPARSNDSATEGRDGAASEGMEETRRVLLKVSGEALAGEQGFGIDPVVVQNVAREVASAVEEGIQVAIVVGGGNFFRGSSFSQELNIERASADYMGMLATVMNALSLQSALEQCDVPTRVQTAIEMKEVAEPYIRRRCIRHLEKGRVVIFGAGTGNPFFTTDTCAALRAAEIGAACLLKATKVDGVYEEDPVKNPNAKLISEMSFAKMESEPSLAVMDKTAVTLCRENDIPVVVFNIKKKGTLTQAVQGSKLVGTVIK